MCSIGLGEEGGVGVGWRGGGWQEAGFIQVTGPWALRGKALELAQVVQLHPSRLGFRIRVGQKLRDQR
jgi:hypothetical protein